MQTTTMTFGPWQEPAKWWECDWTPGRGRKFGPPHVDLFGEGHRYIGSAGGPPEIEACLNVRNAAERICRMMEQALIDFVIARYRFYRDTQPTYAPFACKLAVARDAGVDVERVSFIVAQTYAWAA